MNDNPLTLLHGLLPDQDISGQADDIVAYLTERYGEPERSRTSDQVERLSFAVPEDRRLDVFLSVDTAAVVGALVFFQAAPPPPCPTPGPTGATFSPSATGTAFYILRRGAAFQRALLQAVANGIANYGPLRATICPALCPPPCACNTPLAGVPTITQTVAIRRVWGIPVGFDLTVSINATFNVVCV